MFRFLVAITVETLIACRVDSFIGNRGNVIAAVVVGFFESFVSAVFDEALSVGVITWCFIFGRSWWFRFAFANCFVDVLRNWRNSVGSFDHG